MKRSILTLGLILLAVVVLQAQVELKPTFGINVSRLTSDPENFSQSARVGYQFGGTVQIGKKLYFEPGIFWTNMSSELVHANQSEFDIQTDINGIRIPAFVGYQIIGGDAENIFGLRVFGGPTGSWVNKVSANENDLEKEDFSNFIWGVDVGAGVDVWLIFVDMGYEWGLSEVFKEDANDAKNNMWWFNVGVRIRFGG